MKQPADSTLSLAKNGYVALLAMSGLGAYSLGPVPIEWMMYSGWIVLAGFLALRGRLVKVPGTGVLALFALWMAISTGLALGTRAVPAMPADMTTSLYVFVLLRFLVFASFVGCIYSTYYILTSGGLEDLFRWIAITGAVFALAALYIYIAQLTGLPEIPRTRMGTGGGQQNTVFDLAVHRALGTFREPSHLAEWLITPFFICIGSFSARLRWIALPVGLVLLMTYSLTGVLSLAAGLILAVIIVNPVSKASMRVLAGAVGTVALLGVALVLLGATSAGQGNDLFGALFGRLGPVIEGGGLGASDRGYVYAFIHESAVPTLGYGAGVAQITLSAALNIPLVASFLSLYFSTLFSYGYLGLGLLIWFLVRPILALLAIPIKARSAALTLVFGAYLAWLIIYSVDPEEFSVMFAITFATIMFLIRRDKQAATAPAIS